MSIGCSIVGKTVHSNLRYIIEVVYYVLYRTEFKSCGSVFQNVIFFPKLLCREEQNIRALHWQNCVQKLTKVLISKIQLTCNFNFVYFINMHD